MPRRPGSHGIPLIPAALLLCCLAPVRSAAQSAVRVPRFLPASAAAREAAARILEGTVEFRLDGVPGELAVFGPEAFPLVRDSRGRDIAAVLAAPKRRAVLLGHDCWFKDATLARPDVRRMMENAVAWMLDGRMTARVLCYGAFEMSRIVSAQGHAVDAPKKFPSSLAAYDAVVLYIPTSYSESFSEASAALLQAALDGGMPMIAASIGWVYESYGEGRKGAVLETDFAGNRIFSPCGLSFLPDFADAKALPVPVREEEHRTLAALEKAETRLRGGGGIGTDEARSFLKELYARAARIPDWSVVMSAEELALFAASVSERAADLVPTENRPVGLDDTRRSVAIVLAELMARRHTGLFQALYPHIGAFPGQATGPADAPRTLAIDMRMAGWQSLGIYVNAGETIVLEFPDLQAADRVVLRIGCHSDDLVNAPSKESWMRWPVITQTQRLTRTRTEILARCSGPVYLEVPVAVTRSYGNGGGRADLSVTVGGGAAMPVFRLGTDAAADFLRDVAGTRSPWLEVSGRGVSFTIPTRDLPQGFDPAGTMEWWDRAAAAILDLAGREPYGYPLRFVADLQPSMGYMHSGYPIVTCLDVASYQLGGAGTTAEWRGQSLRANGAWGHFHEMGHMVQSPAWTFTGAGEVTVNLFTLYAMEAMTGVKPLEHPYLLPYRRAVEAYRIAPDWESWKRNPFLALHTYAYLIDAFGWEALREVLRAYKDMPQEKLPKTDQEKQDAWVRQYSLAVKRNLAPYFRSWAWPVSDAAAGDLAALPAWP